jgi:hypothetical protein
MINVEALRERFDQYVYPDPNSGCFIWGGSSNPKGYGDFGIGSRTDGSRRNVRAHHIAWLLAGRVLPVGAHILHKCDMPWCVNPDHLFLGDPLSNAVDRARKNRGTKGSLPFGVVRSGNRFAAQITIRLRKIYLGSFATVAKAASVAAAAKAERLAKWDEETGGRGRR